MVNSSVLRIEPVRHINQDGMQFSFKPTIVGVTDSWLIAFVYYNRYYGDLYKFDFITNTWQKLQHANLPNFMHHTMILTKNHLLVVHGTNHPHRSVYETYIGDVMQEPIIRFRLITVLRTPNIIYGEQRLATDYDYMYALSGYDIASSNDITVHFLDPSSRCWIPLYRASTWSIPDYQPFYNPSRKTCIIHHARKLYVFFHRQSLPKFQNPAAIHLPLRIIAFDLCRNVWKRVNTRIHPQDRMATLPQSVNRRIERSLSITEEYSLAQAPHQTELVFVSMGPSWDTWCLNLNSCRWTRIHYYGPHLAWPLTLTIAITPADKIYAIRTTNDPVDPRHVFCANVPVVTPPSD